MSRYNQNNDWRYSDEARARDLRIIWKCPHCAYSYESEPGVNEALPCREHGEPTENCGESYGEPRY